MLSLLSGDERFRNAAHQATLRLWESRHVSEHMSQHMSEHICTHMSKRMSKRSYPISVSTRCDQSYIVMAHIVMAQ